MTPRSAEHRAHTRYAHEVDCEVRTAGGVIPARSRDVSSGGICFTARQPIQLGLDVQLNLSLVFDEKTFSESLLLKARVVWCTGLGEGRHQIGATFIGLTSEIRAYLDMFLRYLREGQARHAEAGADPSRDDDEDQFR
jgi:hypothetical protein